MITNTCGSLKGLQYVCGKFDVSAHLSMFETRFANDSELLTFNSKISFYSYTNK